MLTNVTLINVSINLTLKLSSLMRSNMLTLTKVIVLHSCVNFELPRSTSHDSPQMILLKTEQSHMNACSEHCS